MLLFVSCVTFLQSAQSHVVIKFMNPATSGSFISQSSLPGQSYRLISSVFASSECIRSNCLHISGSSCVSFSEAVQILLGFLHSPIFAFHISIAFV
jgi:hypothetical protein